MIQLSWEKLLSSETLIQRTTAEGQEGRDKYDGRTPFDSDYDRIILAILLDDCKIRHSFFLWSQMIL